MKESVDRDMAKYSHDPEDYSYGTSDPWDESGTSEPQDGTAVSSVDQSLISFKPRKLEMIYLI